MDPIISHFKIFACALLDQLDVIVMAHLLNLIPGLVFPNKLSSIMSPKEHEELKTQVEDLPGKGLIQESKSSYAVPTMLVHEKGGSWRMCFDC